jgi:site-specific DNA-methyltransferase (adenine-specific)
VSDFHTVEIGNAKLILGDCREVLPTLGPVDHIITDPPYGAALHAHHDARVDRSRDGSNRKELGYEALTVSEASDLASQFLTMSQGWIVWMTDSDLAPKIKEFMQAAGRTTFPPLPYYHSGRSVRLAGDGPCSWTDWIVVARTKALNKWGTLRGGYIANEGWNDKARMGGKPTRLMQMLVCDYSRPGETVCDPFMGAGTTGVACAKEGRAFIGIEIDPEAFELSCKRIDEAQRQGSLFGSEAA